MSVQLTRDDLEAQLDDLDRRMEDAALERARDRQRISDLEALVDDLAETVDTLQTDLVRTNKEKATLARRLTAVEDELDVDPATVGDGGTPLPLDLLARIGPEAVAEADGPTLQRAYTIAQHREEWGETRTNEKYGRHHVLASKGHGVKTHVEAAREESLEWSQVYRALQKCADLGGNAVVLDEAYGDLGKALVDRRGDA